MRFSACAKGRGARTPFAGKFPAATPKAIALARPADLSFVVGLQKKYGDALGFIPRVALAEKIELERIWLANENGDPAGYLHHGSLNAPEVRIFQAAIQYDAQRRHLGLALLKKFIEHATASGAQAVSLRCLSDLDANAFWLAAGFKRIAVEPGARGALNVWGLHLAPEANDPQESTPFQFHSRVHACPGCGIRTTDTWTRGAVRRRMCPLCIEKGR